MKLKIFNLFKIPMYECCKKWRDRNRINSVSVVTVTVTVTVNLVQLIYCTVNLASCI